MARLKKSQWLEAEELYRHGWTQKQIAEKFGVRIETVSIHMRQKSVRSGEKEDVVRHEIERAVQLRTRDFAEKKAGRQIETKESFYTLVRSLVQMFVKDVKTAQEGGAGLAMAGGAAKALKEALSGVKLAREELYTILEIPLSSSDESDLPELGVSTLTQVEENILRARKGGSFDEETDDELTRAEAGFAEEQSVEDELEPLEDDDDVVEEGVPEEEELS